MALGPPPAKKRGRPARRRGPPAPSAGRAPAPRPAGPLRPRPERLLVLHSVQNRGAKPDHATPHEASRRSGLPQLGRDTHRAPVHKPETRGSSGGAPPGSRVPSPGELPGSVGWRRRHAPEGGGLWSTSCLWGLPLGGSGSEAQGAPPSLLPVPPPADVPRDRPLLTLSRDCPWLRPRCQRPRSRRPRAPWSERPGPGFLPDQCISGDTSRPSPGTSAAES